MSKDYVSRRRQTRKKSRMPGSLLTIVSSFLCGYLAASVFDFTSLSDWVTKNVIHNKNSEPMAEAKASPAVKVKPKFEFYTLLSRDNSAPSVNHPALPVASVKTQPPQAQTSTEQTAARITTQATHSVQVTESKALKPATPAGRETYLIQLASFNKREDAEHMKASLVLSGFDVSIASIAQNNVTWFRVIIGPFTSRAEAEKAQLRMVRTEHVQGMIRRV